MLRLLLLLRLRLQCVELDFQYPSEGIHRRWDAGFRITACAATPDQSAFVLSVPRRRPMDETQVRLCFSGRCVQALGFRALCAGLRGQGVGCRVESLCAIRQPPTSFPDSACEVQIQ
jgi:hypothetical protein